MVKKYFASLEEQISLFQSIISTYKITTKYYSLSKGFVSCNIVFIDKSKLSFKEVKDIEFHKKDKYSYNYMDFSGKMIFRFDNAYHYPEIKTYPHHKHLPNNIIESDEPELIDVLIEISNYIK